MIKIADIETIPRKKGRGFGCSGLSEIAKNDVIKFAEMPSCYRCAEITTQHKNRESLKAAYRKACRILTGGKIKIIVRKERLFLVK